MKERLLRIKNNPDVSDNLRDVGILFTGTSVAQLIPILLQPILRRLFEPVTFGFYAIYLSIYGILTVVSSLRYEQAIPIARTDSEAKHIFWLSTFISVIFNTFLLFVFIVWSSDIIQQLGISNSFKKYLIIIPFASFTYSINQIINLWFIRKAKFKRVAGYKFIRRISEGIVHLSSGLVKVRIGLMLGDIFGNLIICLMGLRKFLSSEKLAYKTSLKSLKRTAKRYSDFPTINLIPYLLNTISFLIIPLIINKHYNEEVVGLFDLTRQVLALPFALISTSVSQVLFQRIASRRRDGTTISYDIRFFGIGLTLIAVITFALLFPFAPAIFGFVFGHQWRISGEFTQIIIFNALIRFIVSPLSIVFVAIERITISSIWQVIYFLGIASLFYVKDLTIIQFLKTYALIEVTAYLLYMVIIVFQVRQYDSGLASNNYRK